MKQKLKNLLALGLCVLMLAAPLAGCGKPTTTQEGAEPTGLVIEAQKSSFLVGDTYQLLWGFQPADARKDEVFWTSSDPAIVSVDENGKITAKSDGVCTITGSTAGDRLSDSVEITVTRPKPEKYVRTWPSVTMDYAEPIYAGTTYQIKWNFEPWACAWPEIKWESNNEALAIVDENGLVTALGAHGDTGVVTISGTYTMNGVEYTDYISFNVKEEQKDYSGFDRDYIVTPGTSLVFRHPKDSYYSGYASKTGFSYYPVLPPLEGEEDIEGAITMKTEELPGEVVRTLTFHVSDVYEVSVEAQTQGDKIDCRVLVTDAKLPKKLTLEVGESYTILSPEKLKSSGERFSLQLTSNNDDVAYVDGDSLFYGGDGKIHAKEPGTATVKLYSTVLRQQNNMDVVSTCEVTVEPKTVPLKPPSPEKATVTIEPMPDIQLTPVPIPPPTPAPTPAPTPVPTPAPTPTPAFVPVTNITNVPAYVIQGKTITLSGTVEPANASYQQIEWSIIQGADYNVELNGDQLKGRQASALGTHPVIRATVKSGGPGGTDYEQDFTVKVEYDITVQPGSGPLADGVQGSPYQAELEAMNGAGAPYTFTLQTGDLPAGLALTADPVDSTKANISGTVDAAAPAQDYAFTVRVADKDGNYEDALYVLTVTAAAPEPSSPVVP